MILQTILPQWTSLEMIEGMVVVRSENCISIR